MPAPVDFTDAAIAADSFSFTTPLAAQSSRPGDCWARFAAASLLPPRPDMLAKYTSAGSTSKSARKHSNAGTSDTAAARAASPPKTSPKRKTVAASTSGSRRSSCGNTGITSLCNLPLSMPTASSTLALASKLTPSCSSDGPFLARCACMVLMLLTSSAASASSSSGGVRSTSSDCSSHNRGSPTASSTFAATASINLSGAAPLLGSREADGLDEATLRLAPAQKPAPTSPQRLHASSAAVPAAATRANERAQSPGPRRGRSLPTAALPREVRGGGSAIARRSAARVCTQGLSGQRP
mmetsp:Transcript_9049/g.24104  ORF Transcript_9049/g.24104 Transcript_9049/m.24104 type:complete len:297 (+) Transcript_9049:112-1002(+)